LIVDLCEEGKAIAAAESNVNNELLTIVVLVRNATSYERFLLSGSVSDCLRACLFTAGQQYRTTLACIFITSAKEVMFLPVFVCLFVCLLAR